jgi:hypothetical protein
MDGILLVGAKVVETRTQSLLRWADLHPRLGALSYRVVSPAARQPTASGVANGNIGELTA